MFQPTEEETKYYPHLVLSKGGGMILHFYWGHRHGRPKGRSKGRRRDGGKQGRRVQEEEGGTGCLNYT